VALLVPVVWLVKVPEVLLVKLTSKPRLEVLDHDTTTDPMRSNEVVVVLLVLTHLLQPLRISVVLAKERLASVPCPHTRPMLPTVNQCQPMALAQHQDQAQLSLRQRCSTLLMPIMMVLSPKENSMLLATRKVSPTSNNRALSFPH
jgi:hypothetical protein